MSRFFQKKAFNLIYFIPLIFLLSFSFASAVLNNCEQSCNATCGYAGGPACEWIEVKECCPGEPTRCASVPQWIGKVGRCDTTVGDACQEFSNCVTCTAGGQVCAYSNERNSLGSQSTLWDSL
ncbi:hypothetical protein L6252_00660 [Candidatus Parcubacteria bacterium]|nr:hypothetical protein [Candidatus Parcubacteria bacterium]